MPEDVKTLEFEKKLIDVQLTVSQLEEKINAMDTTAATANVSDFQQKIEDVQQRIEDVEDLAMVEQAGIIELKKMLEEQPKQAAEMPQIPPSAVAISPEELDKVANIITDRWKEKFTNLEKKIVAVEIPQNFPDSDEIKKQVQYFADQLNNLKFVLNSEMGQIKEKMVTEDLAQTIISEVSDLRTEYGREIRSIKERIGSAPLYADIQFLSNRVKDMKQVVDNLLNMRVEIDSKILNLERSMVESEAMKLPGNLDREIDNIKRELISNGKKTLTLERTIQESSKKFENLNVGEIGRKLEVMKEVESLYAKINEIYMDLQRKVDTIGKSTPVNIENKIRNLEERIGEVQFSMKDVDNKIAKQRMPANAFDDQVHDLIERIIFLETRIRALERTLQQSSKLEPIILE